MWADCVDLLAIDDVCLVTSDAGFYKNRKYAEGLSPNLIAEAATQPHHLRLFASLGDFLKDIRTEVQIDKQMLADSYLSSNGETAQSLSNSAGYRIANLIDVATDLFITENPDQLFVRFVIEYQCISLSNSTLEPAVLTLHGEGTYSPSENRFTDFSRGESQIAYTLADGRQETRHNYVLKAEGFVLGHRTLTHVIRTHVE